MSTGKKIAIIGPSHVAALKMASQAVLVDYPDFEISFFAAPGPLFRKMDLDPVNRVFGAIHEGNLTGQEISLLRKLNKADRITLDGFDAIVLAGHDIKEKLNARILTRFAIDGTNHSKPSRRLSMPAYRAMLAEAVEQALPKQGWWNWQGARVFATPAPRIAENCVEVKSRTVASWVPLVQCGLTQPQIFNVYMDALRGGFAKVGITFVPNPDETYGKHGLTKAEYARSAVYIRPGEHRADFDAKHMNAEFGALCLRNLFHVIEENHQSVVL